ncbi:MAG: hypothetical protein ABIB97_02560 [Patescibacteria group bacterium]
MVDYWEGADQNDKKELELLEKDIRKKLEDFERIIPQTQNFEAWQTEYDKIAELLFKRFALKNKILNSQENWFRNGKGSIPDWQSKLPTARGNISRELKEDLAVSALLIEDLSKSGGKNG